MEMNGQLHAVAALPPAIECLVHIQCEAECTPVPLWMLWRRDEYHAAISQDTVPPTLVSGSDCDRGHFVRTYRY